MSGWTKSCLFIQWNTMQQQNGLATDTFNNLGLPQKHAKWKMLNTKYHVSCDSIYMKFLEKAKAIEISCFLETRIGTGMDWKQAWRTLWWGEGCVLKLDACTTSYICYTIYQTVELEWMSFWCENDQLRKLLTILRVKKGKV